MKETIQIKPNKKDCAYFNNKHKNKASTILNVNLY